LNRPKGKQKSFDAAAEEKRKGRGGLRRKYGERRKEEVGIGLEVLAFSGFLAH